MGDREEYNEYLRNYYHAHPKTQEQAKRRSKLRYRELKESRRQTHLAVKVEAFVVYGGDPPKCACCGETNVAFLTLDHMNDDGYLWRRMIGHRNHGTDLYDWLKRQGFPKDQGLQVMCYNCNMGRAHNQSVCPHKTVLSTSSSAVTPSFLYP